jgi:phosphoglucosamine mutase
MQNRIDAAMTKLFGTDGIRGKANIYPMDVHTAASVGRAVGRHFISDGQGNHVLIAQDTRTSGDMLAMAVGAGVCSSGMGVSLVGVLPTPGLARLVVENEDAAAGVVISASHNPFEDNGIKLFDGNGYKLSETTELQIESHIEKGEYTKPSNSKTRFESIGRMAFSNSFSDAYLRFLLDALPNLSLTDMTIVLDCANGATFQIAPELFERLGANVIPLFVAPDGTNINADCGSQHPETLAQTVLEYNADMGLAFDGDGDRLITVDEKGNVLTGDQLMAICANDLKQSGELTNDCVVCTIMSNLGFHEAMEQIGVRTITTAVGDRSVMECMRSEGAILGGEDSGHIIFHDVHTTGDGILAAIRLIDAVQKANKPLSQLSQVMTVFPQTLINISVKEKPALESVPEIKRVIEEVSTELGDAGRVLVRYSGTENKCRVMVEGPKKDTTDGYCKRIAEVIRLSLG